MRWTLMVRRSRVFMHLVQGRMRGCLSWIVYYYRISVSHGVAMKDRRRTSRSMFVSRYPSYRAVYISHLLHVLHFRWIPARTTWMMKGSEGKKLGTWGEDHTPKVSPPEFKFVKKGRPVYQIRRLIQTRIKAGCVGATSPTPHHFCTCRHLHLSFPSGLASRLYTSLPFAIAHIGFGSKHEQATLVFIGALFSVLEALLLTKAHILTRQVQRKTQDVSIRRS